MPPLRVGLIGAGQIAKPHIAAFRMLSSLYADAANIELDMVAEATEGLAQKAAKRYGFKRWTADWRKLTGDPSLGIVVIATPTYLHKEPAIDAIENGKNVLCEKPLAMNAHEARLMHRAAEKAGVVNMTGFNFRRVPAIEFARQLIERGELGEIYHFRCQNFEDWGAAESTPMAWRFRRRTAGSGALADLGSHVIDLTRHIFGNPSFVAAASRTYTREWENGPNRGRRPKVDVDDASLALLRLQNGAVGVLEASWVASGKKAGLEFEAYGSRGSLFFDMERPGELEIYEDGDAPELRGYRRVLTGPEHPYSKALVLGQPAIGMGYEESIVNEVYDFTTAVRDSKTVSPNFFDGWKALQVADAIVKSSETKSWVRILRP